jgi:hypothetical protein
MSAAPRQKQNLPTLLTPPRPSPRTPPMPPEGYTSGCRRLEFRGVRSPSVAANRRVQPRRVNVRSHYSFAHQTQANLTAPLQ